MPFIVALAWGGMGSCMFGMLAGGSAFLAYEYNMPPLIIINNQNDKVIQENSQLASGNSFFHVVDSNELRMNFLKSEGNAQVYG